jgi:murein DD-endopeptidase MepM/ murein hydrolase activator NlpD
MRTRHWVVSISIAVLAIISLAMSQAVPVVIAAPSGYQMPFFGKAAITNGPGMGAHTERSGEAIDYTPRYGWWSNVAATQTGTVVYSKDLATGFGRVIVIRHGDGTYSYYAHLSQRLVNLNDLVSRGQTIGVVGNTGCGDCGTHLHFEARTGVVEPVTDSNLYNTGTKAWIRDVKGNGWFPWYEPGVVGRDSGLVAYSPSHPKGQCIGNPYLTVIWPKASEISGGSYIEGFSWEFSTSATTIPDTIVDGNGSVGSASRSLSGYNGIKWHLHLRVKQTNGNWAASDWHIVHAGSYCYQ